ncbi:MAG: isopentenyl-diphosphate Delta-isomerase [Bacteroidales bacterium]
MQEKVVLVDQHDKQTGVMEKLEAHKKALLHRAVSVFVFNSENQLLIQKRAIEKYHSPGLWTNTACTHPRPRENVIEAADRRLQEEMGIGSSNLQKLFDFIYKEELDQGLSEHEFDHVFVGFSDEAPTPDPDEVCDYAYMDGDNLLEDVRNHPEAYTVWFKKVIERVLREYQIMKR